MKADARRPRSVFLKAVEQRRPDEWDAYLDETCGGDVALRERVEVLLRAHGESNSLLDASAGALVATLDRAVAETAGNVIGPYKLLEQIGEGGFGVVFMAEQQRPLRRKVALKVLKPGMDTRQVVARFEAERQALALMDHPNIAHVFDGGTTDAGRPYFVMELVRGVPITEFCDQKQLTPRERLELFAPICQAVQHAHHKGVIHRDLKPSNVLVAIHDTVPVVKVIDFGVAKALSRELTDKTLSTGLNQMIGTPLYMSPEQAEQGLDIDTRSDIYSLGVLLYELLTGTTPFDQERLRVAGYDEMRRIVREEEPPKPSTRISTLGRAATTASTQRKSDPRQLSRLLHGELDWIVMKSLEKDRNRRYETANSLALDVERYLNDEPVLACPPSAGYRLRKFARRNKRALATATLLGVMLLAVVAVLGWAVRDRAVREQQAVRDGETRRAMIEQRVALALEEASKRHQEGRWKEALDAAKRAEALAAGDGDGETRRRARQVLVDMQMLARLENVRVRSKGVELTEECTGNAQAFREYGIDIDVLERDDAVTRIRARPIRHELAVLLDSWSHVRRKLAEKGVKPPKDWKELLQIARAADPNPWRDRFRNAVLNDDRQGLVALAASAPISSLRAETVDRLGDALMGMAAIEEAAAFLKEGQRLHPQDYWINSNLGRCLEQLDPPQLDGAISYFTAALALHPEAAQAHHRLGVALAAKGDLDAAIAQFRAGLRLSDDNPLLHAGLDRALKAKSEGDTAPALRPDQGDTTAAAYAQAESDAALAVRLSQWDKAAAEYAKADLLARPLNEDAFVYACLFLIRGDSEGYQRFCQDMIQRAAETGHSATHVLARGCAMAREAPVDPARAVQWANQAVASSHHFWDFHVLGLAQYRAGQFDDALQSFTKSNVESWAGPRNLNWFALALVHHRLGHANEARQCLDKGLQWLQREAPPGPERPTNLLPQDWLEAQLLRREAEEMLNKPATETGQLE